MTPEILFQYLIKYGGVIISSNDLPPDLIEQARASNRMWVNDMGLGFIWEPPFAGKFPETAEEVELFEWCYPIHVELPPDLTFERLMEFQKKKRLEEKQKKEN